MSEFLIRNPEGFNYGYTSITCIGEDMHDTGINFGILKLRSGEEYFINSPLESAYLLINGECQLEFDERQIVIRRASVFDEEPQVLHLPAQHKATIKAISDCEFSVSEVRNEQSFKAELFDQHNMLESEHRGKGLLDDTAYRIVRTVFDMRNRPQSKLVIGEVITAPGRWSSYPPHHHRQPEIYHYRFTEPQGYGHAECGEQLFKVRQYDTYKILDENDHSQAAAPGYGMYYIWVIRHLDNLPYEQPEFTKEHSWTKSHDANQRVWKSF